MKKKPTKSRSNHKPFVPKPIKQAPTPPLEIHINHGLAQRMEAIIKLADTVKLLATALNTSAIEHVSIHDCQFYGGEFGVKIDAK